MLYFMEEGCRLQALVRVTFICIMPSYFGLNFEYYATIRKVFLSACHVRLMRMLYKHYLL